MLLIEDLVRFALGLVLPVLGDRVLAAACGSLSSGNSKSASQRHDDGEKSDGSHGWLRAFPERCPDSPKISGKFEPVEKQAVVGPADKNAPETAGEQPRHHRSGEYLVGMKNSDTTPLSAFVSDPPACSSDSFFAARHSGSALKLRKLSLAASWLLCPRR